MLICRISSKITSKLSSREDPSRKFWSCWRSCIWWRNMNMRRRILIITSNIWRSGKRKIYDKKRRRGWHIYQIRITSWRRHICRIKLVGQNIFIKFYISSKNYFCWIWLKKPISFYIFRVSKKILFSLLGSKDLCFSSRIWVQASLPNTRNDLHLVWLSSMLLLV